MHWSPVLLAACAGVVAAHGNGEHAFPKLLGGRKLMAELMADRGRPAGFDAPPAADQRHSHSKRQRGGTDGQCGPGWGSCARGFCCSSEGYVSTGRPGLVCVCVYVRAC